MIVKVVEKGKGIRTITIPKSIAKYKDIEIGDYLEIEIMSIDRTKRPKLYSSDNKDYLVDGGL